MKKKIGASSKRLSISSETLRLIQGGRTGTINITSAGTSCTGECDTANCSAYTCNLCPSIGQFSCICQTF